MSKSSVLIIGGIGMVFGMTFLFLLLPYLPILNQNSFTKVVPEDVGWFTISDEPRKIEGFDLYSVAFEVPIEDGKRILPLLVNPKNISFPRIGKWAGNQIYVVQIRGGTLDGYPTITYLATGFRKKENVVVHK